MNEYRAELTRPEIAAHLLFLFCPSLQDATSMSAAFFILFAGCWNNNVNSSINKTVQVGGRERYQRKPGRRFKN